jgi:hypothetical protein
MSLFWSPFHKRVGWGMRRAYPHPQLTETGDGRDRWWVEEVPMRQGLLVIVWDNLRRKRERDLFIPFPFNLREKEKIMSFLDDFYNGLEKDQKGGKQAPKDACDASMKKAHPCLHEFMTRTSVGGKPREPGTLFLFCSQGLFTGCLTDKGSELTLWESQDTFTGLLGALEAALEKGDRSLWRTKKKYAKK